MPIVNCGSGEISASDSIKAALEKAIRDRIQRFKDRGPEPGVRMDEEDFLVPGTGGDVGDGVDWKRLVDRFCEGDPTEEKSFVAWIISSYLDGGISSLEDRVVVNRSLLKYRYLLDRGLLNKEAIYPHYPKYCQKVDETDIRNFNGLIGCDKSHTADAWHKEWVTYGEVKASGKRWSVVSPDSPLHCHCNGCPRTGLNALFDKYSAKLKFFAKRGIMSESAKTGTHYLRKEKDYLVVKLLNKDAAKYWGWDTKWCTAVDKNKEVFDHYNGYGSLYIIVDPESKQKYQLHPASRQIMDMEDRPADLSVLVERYPDAFLVKNAYGLKEVFIKDPTEIPSKLVLERDFEWADVKEGEIEPLKEYLSTIEMSTLEGDGYSAVFAQKSIKIIVKRHQPLAFFGSPLFRAASLLEMGDYYNQSLVGVDLPDLTHLIMGRYYVQSLVGINMPHLTHLELGERYNQSLVGVKLPSLTYLKMGDYYDTSLRRVDFPRLTQLEMGHRYDQSLAGVKLPSLTHLKMGHLYNHYLEGVELPGLTHLNMGGRYNESLVGVKMPRLTHLEMGGRYDRSLRDVDFPHLTHLKMGSNYDQTLVGVELFRLTHLEMGDSYNQSLTDVELPRLTHLKMGSNYDQTLVGVEQPRLTHLEMGFLYNRSLVNVQLLNLTKLVMGPNYDRSLEGVKLPNLAKLAMGEGYSHSLERVELPKLTKLVLGDSYNHPFKAMDLSNLTSLYMLGERNPTLVGVNLPKLTHLYIGYHYYKPLKDVDLKNLTHLRIEFYNEIQFNGVKLPNLTHLQMTARDFVESFEFLTDVHPPNLTYLYIEGKVDRYGSEYVDGFYELTDVYYPQLKELIVDSQQIFEKIDKGFIKRCFPNASPVLLLEKNYAWFPRLHDL